MKQSHGKPKNLVQTIERAAKIIEFIGQSPRGISLRDLSKRLALPKGTVHRLLGSLSHFGYVRQDRETKDYFLGLKFLELGNLVMNQLDLRKVAEPLLRELAERVKETVHMVIIDGDEVVYIEKIESEKDLGGLKMASRVGARNPVHSCAVGKVLLSFFTEEDLDKFLKSRKLSQRTPNTITSPRKLKEHLKEVKIKGYAVDDEENEKGIRCVAAPIFDSKGNAVAAISISGPAFRVTMELIDSFLKKEVIRTAFEISKRLGFIESDKSIHEEK